MSIATSQHLNLPHSIKPPFTRSSAVAKIRAAEDIWNSRDLGKVVLAYTEDSQWRNRDQFIQGRKEIAKFLVHKWTRELDYRLIKQLWAFDDYRIAVRFQYEYRDSESQWFRAYGNENWEFANDGLMKRREASINNVAIDEWDRKLFWPLGPRPEDHPGLGNSVK